MTAARDAYQHGRYHEAGNRLPDLVVDTSRALQAGADEDRRRLLILAVVVYQTASGLLLKLDATALAPSPPTAA